MADDNGPTAEVRDEENSSIGGTSSHTDDEPVKKKARTDGRNTPERKETKLEHRLGGILCCAVCLDLPRTAIYQCTNGHLMCAGCFSHLLADARMRDETATCPNCRIEISKNNSSRNLAVEKAVNELPAECQFCSGEFPRLLLDHHESELCEERLTCCKYQRIGCLWRGPFHELHAHEEGCAHPLKSGAEVMEALKVIDSNRAEEKALYNHIFELLSYEKITFNDLQLKPYRTDEFIHKLFYETSRFTAFNNTQWVVKARINDNQKDPTQSCERTLSYQGCPGAGSNSGTAGGGYIRANTLLHNRTALHCRVVDQHVILKTKIPGTLNIHYLILKGPFGEMRLLPVVYRFEFSDENNESPFHHMPLYDSAECNKLLASKAINFRLIMFQVPK